MQSRVILLSIAIVMIVSMLVYAGPPFTGEQEKPWEANKRKTQDKIGGVPQEILDLQFVAKVVVPTKEDAAGTALFNAKKAYKQLNINSAQKGTRNQLIVPDDFTSIQEAINAASVGDVVLVREGTYFELITMKDGISLVSDSSDGGNKLETIEDSFVKIPARTLRTIIDGSNAEASSHGMIDFGQGLGRSTIVDGFTIQNLPKQNHHIPGHAHAINVRGASPVVVNCVIRNNGSTAIGNHVIYTDQNKPMPSRDFRWANIKHQASPVIYNNIIYENLGLGIGCNHFSSPHILGNEIFRNDDSELGEEPTPGIGGQHGSFATVIGNIVYDNPGGGILCKSGKPQGAYPIDRPTTPVISNNVVFDNGKTMPGIAANAAGSEDNPVKITGNIVCNAALTGIGISNGTFAILEHNIVSESKLPGIAINNATVLKLNGNKVRGVKEGPGFIFAANAVIYEMLKNTADSNSGPRFMLRDATIGKKDE